MIALISEPVRCFLRFAQSARPVAQVHQFNLLLLQSQPFGVEVRALAAGGGQLIASDRKLATKRGEFATQHLVSAMFKERGCGGARGDENRHASDPFGCVHNMKNSSDACRGGSPDCDRDGRKGSCDDGAGKPDRRRRGGVLAERQRECRHARTNPASGEGTPQSVQCPVDPHARRILTGSEQLAHTGKGLLVKEAQNDRRSIALGQIQHRFLQHRCDAFPVEVLSLFEFPDFHREPFPPTSPGLCPDHIGRDEGGMAIEPTGENHLAREGAPFGGKVREDDLCDVFSQGRVAMATPQGRGINEIDVAPYQLLEGTVIARPGEVAPGGVRFIHSRYHRSLEAARDKKRTRRVMENFHLDTSTVLLHLIAFASMPELKSRWRGGGLPLLTVLLSVAGTVRQSQGGPRLDQIQIIGTHNSYHISPHPQLEALIRSRNPEAADSTAYTHRPLTDQFERLGIRQIELDLYADPNGALFAQPMGIGLASPEARSTVPLPDPERMRQPGCKILHVPDFDFQTTVPTFREALQEISRWSTNHPAHIPIFVLLELKSDAAGPDFTQPVGWNERLLDDLEREILGVLPRSHLFTPDDLRGSQPTLRQAVQGHGWPSLAEVRGRILFLLDNTDTVRDLYLARNATLSQRLLFASVGEEDPAAAWFKVNDALADHERIQRLVRQGFLVRTRADIGTWEARQNSTQRRDAAMSSGAQLISTDYPERQPSWSSYEVRWPGGIIARANPVNTSGADPALDLEELGLESWEPFQREELVLLNRRAFTHHWPLRRLAEASRDYARLLELNPPRRPTRDEEGTMLKLAPLLSTHPEEPFALSDVVALHHPTRPLIAYHLFWDDDIDFPEDNDPADHEVVWVAYEPLSGRPTHLHAYFHGRILNAEFREDRPTFAVEWGKHGSLPMDRNGLAANPPNLQTHWSRLHERGIRFADHPLASRWPKRFNGDWRDYLRFQRTVDSRALLERRRLLWVSEWANATLDQYALTYNFAPKIEWPEEGE